MSSVKISNLTKKQADMFVSWFTEIGIGRNSFNDFLITNGEKEITDNELIWDSNNYIPIEYAEHEIVVNNMPDQEISNNFLNKLEYNKACNDNKIIKTKGSFDDKRLIIDFYSICCVTDYLKILDILSKYSCTTKYIKENSVLRAKFNKQ